ncbi:MAG: assembly factor cbp4 [Vezdaea acicularis]|nr:MAG: assembly factor cbp4 [Vezdaea acicularis]
MVNAKLWAKMIGWGGLLCVGGPALVIYVTPTEEELRSRYNPDLKRRSLEGQTERREQFNNFVGQLKEYSKSDKPSMPPPSPSFFTGPKAKRPPHPLLLDPLSLISNLDSMGRASRRRRSEEKPGAGGEFTHSGGGAETAR